MIAGDGLGAGGIARGDARRDGGVLVPRPERPLATRRVYIHSITCISSSSISASNALSAVSTSSRWNRVLSAGSAVRLPAPSASRPASTMAARSPQLGVGPAFRGEGGDEALERLAHLEQLGRPGVGQHHHAGAAPRLELDEALAGERLQRFAHRVAADTEILGELVLEDALALRERAGDDPLADLVAHGDPQR